MSIMFTYYANGGVYHYISSSKSFYQEIEWLKRKKN